MSFYPLLVQLDDRPCVVVGGGAVGERKVQGLLDAGARVTVVSPSLTASLAALAEAGRIGHVARVYRPGDLEGAALAFAAVGDPAVTEALVCEAARALGRHAHAVLGRSMQPVPARGVATSVAGGGRYVDDDAVVRR